MSTVIQIYTKVQLDAITQQAEERLDKLNSKFAKFSIYGMACPDQTTAHKLYLYLWALGYWTQYENGDTTDVYNYISQEQLTNIINAIKEIL